MSSNSNALQAVETSINHAILESLALKGDLSGLKPEDKVLYLDRLCTSLGLNPLTQPFTPLKLNGKEILYATRGATDQLASIHKLTREIIKTEIIQDVYIATCKVSSPDGRFDISTGAVTIGNLKGDNLANALMKAETKAKRRATLCYCGLGFLDETEIETIPADRIEYPARPATKGELTSRIAMNGVVQVAGKMVEEPAFTGPPSRISTKTFSDLRAEIKTLAETLAIDPIPTLNYVDQNPGEIERAYCKVARKVVKEVIGAETWGSSEDGTTAYLEQFGITAIDEAGRGQLEGLIAKMRADGHFAAFQL